ncbi:hypothetical protein [Lysinibacillus sphaericus]|uniref:hypothetical protein n=1 Tax=Lysinibacillus sphaericus TaxID=1421 RepID=UPI002DB8DB51|nr:hypothetical protein [Lysinibacillus sphaericus]MEB7452489.1 hypothetical protein [Lysinibacillus sphaericus]
MSTDTVNYGFKKDNEDEFYNVNVVNANLDKIDTEMKRIEDTIPTVSPTDSVTWLETVGGTANALTANVPDIESYKNGLAVSFPVNANSTAAMTLNINGLGAIPIKKANGTAFSNAKANGVYTVRYRAGAFILQGESEVEIGKQIITPSTVNQAITQGVHDGTGYVHGSTNLMSQNIKKGVTIFNVSGTYEGELSGYDSYYLSPVTNVPKTQPFYTIPMTGGYRIALFMPNNGPSGSGDRDYMNGGSYPTMDYRHIDPNPRYGTNGYLQIIVNSSDGRSWTYNFPLGYNQWFPWFSVILSGTRLDLRAYYEYDKPVIDEVYNRAASAVHVNTTLAYSGVNDISSIQFKMFWEYDGVTHTSTSVQGIVQKYK